MHQKSVQASNRKIGIEVQRDQGYSLTHSFIYAFVQQIFNHVPIWVLHFDINKTGMDPALWNL